MAPIRSRRLALTLLLSLALALALALAGCTAGAPGSSEGAPATTFAPPDASTTPGAVASATASDGVSFSAEIDVSGGPDFPTEGFGSLWVLAADGPLMDGSPPMVHRIDPGTNAVVASIELPGRTCQGIGVTPDAVWACGDDELVGIDPATNEITKRVAVPTPLAVSRLAYGADTLWAFSTTGVGPDIAVRIDPVAGELLASIPLGAVARSMAFGHDALWVTSPTTDALLRVDPATNAVEEWSTGIEGAGVVAVGGAGIWVSLFGDGQSDAPGEDEPTLVQVDPLSGDVLAEVATGGSLGTDGGLVATDDAIWLRGPAPFLAVVDPATAEVLRQVERSGGGGDVTVAFDSVWLTSHERNRVWRMDAQP